MIVCGKQGGLIDVRHHQLTYFKSDDCLPMSLCYDLIYDTTIQKYSICLPGVILTSVSGDDEAAVGKVSTDVLSYYYQLRPNPQNLQ